MINVLTQAEHLQYAQQGGHAGGGISRLEFAEGLDRDPDPLGKDRLAHPAPQASGTQSLAKRLNLAPSGGICRRGALSHIQLNIICSIQIQFNCIVTLFFIQIDDSNRRAEATLDAKDRIVATHHPDGSLTAVEYDGSDKPTKACDGLLRCTEQKYDARGQLEKTSYPDGTFETIGYDENGNVIK